MPCLLVLLALATPRLVILLVYFFSSFFKGLYQGALIPILGFIFLPTTFLWYSAVQKWWAGQWSFWPVVGIIIALMIDISPAGGRRRRKVVAE
jgi:hypothetical protein